MNHDTDHLRDRHEREAFAFEAKIPQALRDAITDGELEKEVIICEWSICDYCRGNGGHSRRFGIITSQEMDEYSDEFRKGYTSGAFDETCQPCDGSGKVWGLNEEFLSEEAQAFVQALREAFYDSQSEEWGERYC